MTAPLTLRRLDASAPGFDGELASFGVRHSDFEIRRGRDRGGQ